MSNALLQVLAGESVSDALLHWVQILPLNSCQCVTSLSELRDTVALSEILCEIDPVYFKELKMNASPIDNTLWLVHLVQLKKLFLKLSSFVELYLQQDWSLLPVPDFKAVARAESSTNAHLNFIVSAVLLTATHSGKSRQFERTLDVMRGPIRQTIESIHESFMNALQSQKSTNSPRKSAVSVTSISVQPRMLFQSSITTEEPEIPIRSLETSETVKVKPVEPSLPAALPPMEDSSRLEELESEMRILKLQNSELSRNLQLAKDRDALEAEAREVLIETQTQLFLLQDQLQELRNQRDLERLEKNSHQVTFDQERSTLEEVIAKLRKENESVTELKEERTWLQEALNRATKEKEELQLRLADAEANESKITRLEADQARLISALKKGQKHVLKQTQWIRELEERSFYYEGEIKRLQEEVERLLPFEPLKEGVDLILL